MAKPELGTKRLCANCGAKFYDLSKDPIHCPKCGTVYEVEAMTRGGARCRRGRARRRPGGSREEERSRKRSRNRFVEPVAGSPRLKAPRMKTEEEAVAEEPEAPVDGISVVEGEDAAIEENRRRRGRGRRRRRRPLRRRSKKTKTMSAALSMPTSKRTKR